MELFVNYWAVAGALLPLAVLFLVLRWWFREPSNLPPGPWELPLLGSLPALAWGVARGEQPHHLFGKYAERYGPVFRVELFNKTLVILDEFELTKAAFQHPQLNNRPPGMGGGVSGSSGEPWVQIRRFSLNVLRGLGVGKSRFEEQIGTEGIELMREMSAFKGKPFDPKSQLSSAVANVICSVVFGKRYEYNDREFCRLLDLQSRVITSVGIGGVFYLFQGVVAVLQRSKHQKLIADYRQIQQFTRSIIDTHRSRLDPHNLNDFVDVYLMEIQRNQARGTEDESTSYWRLNDRNMVFTVLDLFSAGSETTVTTLQWCILYMVLYPEVQQRVQAEIDAVVGRNRLPRLADKPDLNFTRAVIWEVQRMASIVPLGLPHVAVADTYLKGFLIPKGAIIVSNMWRITRDPKLWPEPERFNPERFLDDKGKAFRPEEFIPFGVGRRICLGEHLAKMELFIFFSYFMHRYTFKKPAGSPPLTLEGNSSLTYSPLPFEICAVERDSEE